LWGNAFGQKEQNIWVSGELAGINYNSESQCPSSSHCIIDIWRTNASILRLERQFYCFILTAFGISISISISCRMGIPKYRDFLGYGYDELPVPDGAVIIPFVGDSNKFYLVHTDLKYINISEGRLLFSYDLYYSIIDMNLDNGLGGVIPSEKEILFFSDTLTNTGIQAVKHGNGKDWWLICHEYGSNNYYSF